MLSGASARDSHVHETAISTWVKTAWVRQSRAAICHCQGTRSRMPVHSSWKNRDDLFSLLTKECLSLTIIDPRHRGGPQAAAVVIKGIAVSIQGMVEVGIVPEMGTETFTGVRRAGRPRVRAF